MHYTWITISEAALQHNITTLEEMVAPAELGCVIKNNAYGHGIDQLAHMLLVENPQRYLFTVGTNEAVHVKQQYPQARVCAMSFIDTSHVVCAQHDIACVVYTKHDIDALNAVGQQYGKSVYVHLKVDTGMHRFGVAEDEAPWFIQYISSCQYLYLEGLFTHLSDLGVERQRTTPKQVAVFDDLYKQYKDQIPYWHAGSSGSIVDDYRHTLLRVGSSLYGVTKSYKQNHILASRGITLQPVLSWHTRIMQIKRVPQYAPVGYDAAFITQRPTRIALLPIGYGDGYPQSLTNQSYVIVRGKYAPVIGAIGMNIITVDVTDIPEVVEHDVVTLIGNGTYVHIGHLAQQSGRMALEILSRINPDIPRIKE